MKRQLPNAIIYVYADDIVIISDNVQKFNNIAPSFSTELAGNGLQVNHEKS